MGKKELVYNPKTGSFDKVTVKNSKKKSNEYNPKTGSFEREPQKKLKSKKKAEIEEEDADTNSEKESVIYKGFTLIPDSIFGISIYVLIILFCIWFLGDSGGECGVDYAPRFFGEC